MMMNNICKEVAKILKKIYGWGIMLSVFLGGFTVFGFIAALIIGGETGFTICEFLYKKVFTFLIYAADIFVLLGLISMYFNGEKSMTMKKTK